MTTARVTAPPELEEALQEFMTLEDEIATLEETLSEKKARARYLGENSVVEMVDHEMLNAGVVLSDGSEWTFERKVTCGVSEANKPVAFAYLEDKGADALLRREVIISFGKESKRAVATFRSMLAKVLPQYEVGIKVGDAPETLVSAVKEMLRAADLGVTVEEVLSLPGATLSAFVKKELKAGRTLPDAFGVWAPLRAVRVEPTAEEAAPCDP